MARQWLELNLLKKHVPSAMTTIRDNDFLIVPYCDKDCTTKIFKANNNLDELKPFINNTSDLKAIAYNGEALYSIAFNDKSDQIYLIKHGSQQLIIIDYKTKQFEIFDDKNSIHDSYQCLLNINGQMHLIGGSNKHFIWNNQIKLFQTIHKFEQFNSLRLTAVYVHSKEMIVSIGGLYYTHYLYEGALANRDKHFGIRIYDLKTQNWKVIFDKCPWVRADSHHEQQPVAVVTSDDNNIIIGVPSIGDVYVLNIENETYTLKKTAIHCPITGYYHWLRIGNALTDQMVVNGYIKRLFRMKEFKNIMLPPVYIVKLISKWYKCEEIHLIQFNVFAEQNKHYCMPIKTILSSIV